jgi:UDP-glucose 4-epimerase
MVQLPFESQQGKIKCMKILITGGAGFIASNIADAYIDLGHEVVIIDNLSTGRKEFVNSKAVFYEVDICDQAKIDEIFEKEKPDVLNHHAAQISVRHSVENPSLDAQINLLGLLNLLEAGRKHGLKKVIFASSGGVVYGEASEIPTPDTYQPLEPLSPYGVTKLASEKYLYFYYKTYGLPYVALRYANIYGPRQNPHGEAGVIAIFSLKLLGGTIPIINGDGQQLRDYVFVDDVVEANKAALITDAVGTFNIGTGIQTSVVQLYEGICEAIGSTEPASFGPAKPGEQRKSCLDATKARQILGWEPHILIKDGLKKTVEFFKAYAKN